MKQARMVMSLKLLGEALRLPEDVAIMHIEPVWDREAQCQLFLTGDGLPDWTEEGDPIAEIEAVYESVHAFRFVEWRER